jgi:hypothetical protein
VLDEQLPDAIPPNDYVEYYRPDYRLHLDPARTLAALQLFRHF